MQTGKVAHKLEFLHSDASKDYRRVGKGIIKSIFRPMQPSDFEHAYLPISKEQGEEMQQIILKNNCKNIIEFGTSFGISTIYLADAARKTNGKVISTELIQSKADKAIQNIEEAGLEKYVNVQVGDAMQTLKDQTAPIDFLFLDGWKDLYLPLFKMLEPLFHADTIIYADNMNMKDTKAYADYIHKNKNIYQTKSTNGGKAFITSLNN